MRFPDIVVVGSGRVAEALCRELPVVQVFARNPERGHELAALAGCRWESDPRKLAPAGLYLLAVSDRAIGEVSASLDFGGGLAVHTSGSCDLNDLAPNVARRGVFYPLQTFSEGRSVDLGGVPVLIEAEHEADLAVLEHVASALRGRALRSDALLRRKVHVAAVFVCNFVNGLYTAGEEWMRDNELDFSLLKPLIAETTQKMLASPSPRHVQTGPAARGDRPTIEAHRALLENRPDLLRIYNLMTEYIIENQINGKF